MRYYYWSHSAKPTKAATFHPLDPSELPRSDLVSAVRAGVESGTIEGTSSAEIRFWVSPVDDVDALGDYGGFTFNTRREAAEFVENYYEDEQQAIGNYYDDDHEIPLLMIETMLVVATQVISVSDGGSET